MSKQLQKYIFFNMNTHQDNGQEDLKGVGIILEYMKQLYLIKLITKCLQMSWKAGQSLLHHTGRTEELQKGSVKQKLKIGGMLKSLYKDFPGGPVDFQWLRLHTSNAGGIGLIPH